VALEAIPAGDSVRETVGNCGHGWPRPTRVSAPAACICLMAAMGCSILAGVIWRAQR